MSDTSSPGSSVSCQHAKENAVPGDSISQATINEPNRLPTAPASQLSESTQNTREPTTGDKRDEPATEMDPPERASQRRRIEEDASSIADRLDQSTPELGQNQQAATPTSPSQSEPQDQDCPRVPQRYPMTAKRARLITRQSNIMTRLRSARYLLESRLSRQASLAGATGWPSLQPTEIGDEPQATPSQPTSQETQHNLNDRRPQTLVDNELYEATGDIWVPQERFQPPEIQESLKRKCLTQEISQLTETMELTDQIEPPPAKRVHPSIEAELAARKKARIEKERNRRFSERQRRGSVIKSSSGSSQQASSRSKSSASENEEPTEDSSRFWTSIDWISRDLERIPLAQRATSICLSPKSSPKPRSSKCFGGA